MNNNHTILFLILQHQLQSCFFRNKNVQGRHFKEKSRVENKRGG